jgi:heme/copper-type cytochrome/quinol oxidase subunit 2
MGTYFIVSVLILAALLFFPVSKLLWVLSVRRIQRREKRELSQAELDGQLARARFITVIVVLLFSFLFNYSVLGMKGG